LGQASRVLGLVNCWLEQRIFFSPVASQALLFML
jgi:hypothetical protein